MALSYAPLHLVGSSNSATTKLIKFHAQASTFKFPPNHQISQTQHLSSYLFFTAAASGKWRAKVSFFPAFLKKSKDAKTLKEELLDAIAPLDRGADASPEDQERIDQVYLE